MPDASQPSSAATVGASGEHRVLDRIKALVPPPPPWVHLGIGDDAAVIEPIRNELIVVTTDGLVEGVHFERSWLAPRDLGWRALAVNLSDIAAMGATPRAAVLSLGLPAELVLDDLDELVAGVLEAALAHATVLVGGNVTRSPDRLFVDVTVLGSVRRRRVLCRSGARPGDELYVTGTPGTAAAGVRWLQRRSPREGGWLREPSDPDAPELRAALDAYRRPQPRCRMGQLVGRSRSASACMDLSDGLGDALHQVTAASGVGAWLDAAALPLPRLCASSEQAPDLTEADALELALVGGDDYELLFAVPPRRRRQFLAAVRHDSAVQVTRIGAVTKTRELVLRRGGDERPVPGGFAHFDPRTVR